MCFHAAVALEKGRNLFTPTDTAVYSNEWGSVPTLPQRNLISVNLALGLFQMGSGRVVKTGS